MKSAQTIASACASGHGDVVTSSLDRPHQVVQRRVLAGLRERCDHPWIAIARLPGQVRERAGEMHDPRAGAAADLEHEALRRQDLREDLGDRGFAHRSIVSDVGGP